MYISKKYLHAKLEEMWFCHLFERIVSGVLASPDSLIIKMVVKKTFLVPPSKKWNIRNLLWTWNISWIQSITVGKTQSFFYRTFCTGFFAANVVAQWNAHFTDSWPEFYLLDFQCILTTFLGVQKLSRQYGNFHVILETFQAPWKINCCSGNFQMLEKYIFLCFTRKVVLGQNLITVFL